MNVNFAFPSRERAMVPKKPLSPCGVNATDPADEPFQVSMPPLQRSIGPLSTRNRSFMAPHGPRAVPVETLAVGPVSE